MMCMSPPYPIDWMDSGRIITTADGKEYTDSAMVFYQDPADNKRIEQVVVNGTMIKDIFGFVYGDFRPYERETYVYQHYLAINNTDKAMDLPAKADGYLGLAPYTDWEDEKEEK